MERKKKKRTIYRFAFHLFGYVLGFFFFFIPLNKLRSERVKQAILITMEQCFSANGRNLTYIFMSKQVIIRPQKPYGSFLPCRDEHQIRARLKT